MNKITIICVVLMLGTGAFIIKHNSNIRRMYKVFTLFNDDSIISKFERFSDYCRSFKFIYDNSKPIAADESVENNRIKSFGDRVKQYVAGLRVSVDVDNNKIKSFGDRVKEYIAGLRVSVNVQDSTLSSSDSKIQQYLSISKDTEEKI